ncbi:CHAT domain-containing protein [Blastomonas sp. AAP53]|uniref:CHAT domain-containing protein n=1 Tax=Blastomonas sp. AAP53 TaxID=1248760 RepID=UPI0003091C2D|nr:CHAT domain-containing protein [Blastomonas sp. AAP53]
MIRTSTQPRGLRRSARQAGSAMLALAAAIASPALAQGEDSIALRDSFRVGTAGVLCTAQYRPTDPVLTSMFDRGYRVVCRDAASPVASLYALRGGEGDRLDSYLQMLATRLTCADKQITEVEAVGGATTIECRDPKAQVDYRVYVAVRGETVFVAEGLSGYDSALKLALASLVTDRAATGAVDVATTSVSDPAAFARIQAGTLDEESARVEAYVRNNYGAYAESAEFFETLAAREQGGTERTAEFLANQALQQSNMGDFATAGALFARADRLVASSDGVTQRMIRNFRAIDAINQRDPQAALAVLDRPVSIDTDMIGEARLSQGEITKILADRINRENSGLKRLGGVDSSLTGAERAQILDGQALLLRGTALRLAGQSGSALTALQQGIDMIVAVRNGRISSTGWLRAEVATQRALIQESQGDFASARAGLAEALNIYRLDYPQSPGLLSAKARLAAFLARRGEAEASIAMYDELVAEGEAVPSARATMKEMLGPYFAQLAVRADGDASVAARMFTASQLLQRPGVAQTQAVLARELSEGNDEASALFRLAVTRTREISRTSAEIQRLEALPAPTPEDTATLALARESLTTQQNEQTALQSRLGQYSQYRVLSPTSVTLAELQKLLGPREGYYKVSFVGQKVYGQLITADKVRTVSIALTRADLDKTVAKLRDSIVVIENGQPTNYPFDVVEARKLYDALFPGLTQDLASIEHLVYEPDGALLQLPPGLLVEDQKGVDAYLERSAALDADPFDFTGVAWFGRDRRFSIAVSPRSFADVRTIAPARGKQAYLGVGENAPPPERIRMASASREADCEWPINTWLDPIAPGELKLAQSVLGANRANVITQADFSDTALLGRDDLDDYRILHFATHGLVTAPRPECPARPALVTSFGDASSDGLLSFKEIFDLKLDADLVILSACDTAGLATVSASREAGIETGGNFALDGLVRAFVGAGARSVLASHWPVPDDFNATENLISALFKASPGTAMNASLAQAQRMAMDDPLTSHPYYWAAFILLGDGTKPLVQ